MCAHRVAETSGERRSLLSLSSLCNPLLSRGDRAGWQSLPSQLRGGIQQCPSCCPCHPPVLKGGMENAALFSWLCHAGNGIISFVQKPLKSQCLPLSQAPVQGCSVQQCPAGWGTCLEPAVPGLCPLCPGQGEVSVSHWAGLPWSFTVPALGTVLGHTQADGALFPWL